MELFVILGIMTLSNNDKAIQGAICDIWHNDTQRNETYHFGVICYTRHNDTHHKDIQHKLHLA